MSRRFSQGALCAIIIIAAVLISIILPLLSYLNPQAINNFDFKQAHADLEGYDLSDSGPVALAGEWEFYWNERIVTEGSDRKIPDLYIDVPSAWTAYEINGQKLQSSGIASYKTTISNVSSNEPILVSVNNLPGKCKVFIDGECVFSNRGIPGVTGNTSFYTYANPVEVDSGEHTLVVEVDCEFSSGLTALPQLSTYHEYRHSEISSVAVRYGIIGVVALFAIGTVLMCIIRKRVGNQLWLLLLCVIFVFRMLISNEGYMVAHTILGDLNYEFMTSLIFVSTYIIKLCMLMYLNTKLGLKIKQYTLMLVSMVFLVCAFVPYFVYSQIYVATIYMWLQSAAYLVDGFMIYKLSGAVVNKERNAIAFLIIYCVNACAIIIDNFYLNGYIAGEVSFIMPVACMSFIGMMIVLHLIESFSDYKKAQITADLQRELSELNTTLMISQIQPHFLYNALNTIKYMTKKDPKTAEHAIVKFSSYLRANMDSLTQKEPIAFTKELEHVKNYIDIEQLRFGDRLKTEYDIQTENFTIPPLTIQPIVENAIKHGVNQKPEGGTVKISTKEADDAFIVVISDDGVGYDVNQILDDGRSHVGISNIKKRLSTMLDATVEINSVIGEGTQATITIPKNNDPERKI
ncbi:MAG: histidine kinase [Clostridia bacterium]|nr:histidine kinase [Clostridia bacterium]